MSTNLFVSSKNDIFVCKDINKLLDIADEKCSKFISDIYQSSGNTYIIRKEKTLDDNNIITIKVYTRLSNCLLSYETESFWCKIHQNITEYS